MGMPTDWVVMEDLTYATVVQADASWILGHTDGWKSCDSQKVFREGFQRLGAQLPVKKTLVSEDKTEEHHVRD